MIAKRLRLWPAEVVIALVTGLLVACVTGQDLPAVSSEVRHSWDEDYTSLKAALNSRNNPYALLKTGEERKDVAHIQSLLWPTDRTPVDVALRRTAALLEQLKSMPNSPDLGAMEQHLAGLGSTKLEVADDKQLYLSVRAIGRGRRWPIRCWISMR
jgi:hypothetical protein